MTQARFLWLWTLILSRTPASFPRCHKTSLYPHQRMYSMAPFFIIIKKITARLGLPLTEPKAPVEDVIFNIIQRDTSCLVSLPMTVVLLQAVQQTWEHSSSAPTSSKRLGHMYRVQESSAAFLYTHSKSNSLVVSSSSKGKKTLSSA